MAFVSEELNMLKAEDLYNRLKHIKVGATTCRFTEDKCREITPLINKINQLKKLSIQMKMSS